MEKTVNKNGYNKKNRYGGVYFIINGEQEVVYVGKSENFVRKRILNHMKYKDGAVFYKELKMDNKADIGILELFYISKFNPIHNKSGKEDEATIIINGKYPTFEELELKSLNGNVEILIELFQKRYEAKKRLNGFFKQEQQIELERIEEQIAIEYSDDIERALDTTGKKVYYNGERVR